MTFDELCGALELSDSQKTLLNHWVEELEDRLVTEASDVRDRATIQRIKNLIIPFTTGEPSAAALAYAIGKLSVILENA